uniref:DUF6928 family protein n=1 Tax=Streptomyces TaxID=1883 RepID=UPI003AF1B53D
SDTSPHSKPGPGCSATSPPQRKQQLSKVRGELHIRSLSLSPDGGIVENIGEPLPFEVPYWAGKRPAEVIPWPGEDEEPYPLPFHPLDMGEDALRALCGFIVEGRPEPSDVDADDIELHGFLVRDPNAPDPAEKEAGLRAAVAAMGPPRTYVLGPDGTLIERDVL